MESNYTKIINKEMCIHKNTANQTYIRINFKFSAARLAFVYMFNVFLNSRGN